MSEFGLTTGASKLVGGDALSWEAPAGATDGEGSTICGVELKDRGRLATRSSGLDMWLRGRNSTRERSRVCLMS